jgi:hypothetical protein
MSEHESLMCAAYEPNNRVYCHLEPGHEGDHVTNIPGVMGWIRASWPVTSGASGAEKEKTVIEK